jgi:hypothetical protein
MQNIGANIENYVKDQLITKARELGIDKGELGFVLGGFGAISIITDDKGNTLVGPSWTLVVSLRSKLIGYPANAAGFPIPGVLPSHEDFGVAVARLLEALSQVREKEFAGVQ